MSSSITEIKVPNKHGGSRAHNCIVPVLGFTTTYAIRAYYHEHCEFESCSWLGVLDTTLCDKVCQ